MIALLIHSITDFNLQIPANALIFSWITGTAAALVASPRQEKILVLQRGVGFNLAD